MISVISIIYTLVKFFSVVDTTIEKYLREFIQDIFEHAMNSWHQRKM